MMHVLWGVLKCFHIHLIHLQSIQVARVGQMCALKNKFRTGLACCNFCSTFCRHSQIDIFPENRCFLNIDFFVCYQDKCYEWYAFIHKTWYAGCILRTRNTDQKSHLCNELQFFSPLNGVFLVFSMHQTFSLFFFHSRILPQRPWNSQVIYALQVLARNFSALVD